MENFNLKKFLVENKLTTNSKMLNESTEDDKILIDKIKSLNIDVEDALEKAASTEGLGRYFTFGFSPSNLSLRIDHDYIYPNGNKEYGLATLGNTLDRILSTATEKLLSMGLNLGKGDNTSYGKNAFKTIDSPQGSFAGSQTWMLRLMPPN